MLLAAADKLTLRKQSSDLVADLTSQFLQIDERASSSQLLIVFFSQCLHDESDPIL
jgi:hypothetical protein